MSAPTDGGRLDTILAAFTATTMIAHQVAAKTARDSLFLTYFDVTWLPTVTIAAALVSAAAVLLFAGLLARRGPARLIPPIYAASGVLFALEWLFMSGQPQVMSILLFLHISALGSILISGFWSIINERYDPYQGKRVIARLAAAATLGGLLGGVAASAVASVVDPRAILIMLALMHLLCSLALGHVARGAMAQSAGVASMPTHRLLLEPLKRSGLIRRMALLVALVAINAAVLDYLLKSAASAELGADPDRLVHFFSSFYVIVGLGGFLLQTFVGNRALRWLGLGGTMAALPAFVLTGGLFAFLLRHLMATALLRAGTAMFYNSFFRAGFESLYTPIPARDKRASKLLIDVGADRTGDMLGGLVVMLILLAPAMATENLLFAAAGLLSLIIGFLIFSLHRGYVRQLTSNLRDGTLSAADITATDATTQRTIALTQTAVNRDDLLREIARSRRDIPKATVEAAAVLRASAVSDPVVEAIMELRSGDAERIRRVLVGRTLSADLLPHVIPLLTREDVLRDVFRAVRPLASSASGQLVDALLERRTHPLVRRRLPLILSRADNLRAVQGLLDCLDDEGPDVRLRCGQALNRIRSNHAHLVFPVDRLWTCIRAELAGLKAGAAIGREQEDEGLHHLFNLLGVVYSPEISEICYRSLSGDDPGLRGTALELLDNQLPQDIKQLLWPAIAPGHKVEGQKRALQDIARDLLRGSPFRGKGGGDLGDTRNADGMDR